MLATLRGERATYVGPGPLRGERATHVGHGPLRGERATYVGHGGGGAIESDPAARRGALNRGVRMV